MRITSIQIRNFKRFRTPGIREFSATFDAPVQIITAPNGYAKTSLLRELCPLPPVRSLYEVNGYKETHFENDGHSFILISDFSNRNSPHSFQMDGKELNTSGTTDIQEELVAKYFGITSAIRSLIYNKVTLCSTTKAERKNLFLNINPMQLGLILDTHKKTLSKIKDCRANLNHLYARRSDIEARLVKPEILEQHTKTKQKLSEYLLEIDKILAQLDQHITSLTSRYSTDLQYYSEVQSQNRPLFPVNDLKHCCKDISHRVYKYSDIDREHPTEQLERYRVRRTSLQNEHAAMMESVLNVSKEINEYNSHFENATDRPVNKIEDELKALDKELKTYSKLPECPAPLETIEYKERLLPSIQELLFIFRDLEKPLIPEEEYYSLEKELTNLKMNLKLLEQQMGNLKTSMDQQHKEIEQHKQEANVPDTCKSNTCGLKILFTNRANRVEQMYKSSEEKYAALNKEYEAKTKRSEEIVKVIGCFLSQEIYPKYTKLLTFLQNQFPLENWINTLMERLNTQPLLIYKQLVTYLEQSKLAHEYNRLMQKRQLLTKELETVMKTTGASMGFIKSKLQEKEKILKEMLQKVKSLEIEINQVEHEYLVCQEYSTDVSKIREFDELISRGSQALIIENSIRYWTKLKEYFLQARNYYGEELRKIETIVRDQVTLKAAYDNEIIKHIKKYTEEKLIYDKIELALSPTTGLPHKSMVKYLNALINNVNYFINQIWSYKLRILPLDENQPIDYAFRIEVLDNIAGDINELSDGQTEIVNLAWVLAILLQLKLLNKIPFFADEVGRALDTTHRNALLKFLGQMIESKLIEQLFLINHYAVFTDGFRDSDIICLSPENMTDLPGNTNDNVSIVN